MTLLPLTRAALPGSVALASLDVIATVSFVFTTFQFASTAFTVTLNAVPAVSAVGALVFPLPEPGAALSPGDKTCNLANAPGFAVTAELVLGAFVLSLMSVAVTIALPAVFSVTAKVFVPLTNAALAGSTAFASEEVIPAVSV